jgi:hypothetical protein
LRHITKTIRFILGAVLLFQFSCINEIDDVKKLEWNISPEFGIPLAKAELSFDSTFNIGKDSSVYIYPGSDGVLHLKVERELIRTNIKNIFNEFVTDDLWPDEEIPLPEIPAGFLISSPETNFTVLLDTFLVDQQVDSLQLNAGKLEFTFNTLDNYTSASFSIRLPNVKDSKGNTLFINNFVPKKDNNTLSLNLENCRLLFNTGPKTRGKFTITLGYEIVGKKRPANADYPYIDFKMSELDFKSAYGKMGNFKAEFSEVFPLFEDKPLNGQTVDFDLKEPVIHLFFMNQIGIPLSFTLAEAGVYIGKSFEPLTGIPGKIAIEAPALGNANSIIKSALSIDPSNNINRLMSRFPDSLKIAGTLRVNPDNPDRSNFIREEDEFMARLEADIPLTFSLTKISFIQSVPIQISSLQKLENNVEQFKIQSKIKNSFPFELTFQAYFTDDANAVVDSLFKEPMVVKGSSSAGNIAESVFWVDKNNQQIRALKNCKKLEARASIKTTESASRIVSFLSSQKLSVEIAGFTKIKL